MQHVFKKSLMESPMCVRLASAFPVSWKSRALQVENFFMYLENTLKFSRQLRFCYLMLSLIFMSHHGMYVCYTSLSLLTCKPRARDENLFIFESTKGCDV